MSPRALLPSLALVLLLVVPGLATAEVASPIAAPSGHADDPVVNTPNGSVRGIVDGIAIEWRGVPYAAAPIGDRRWRPPAPSSLGWAPATPPSSRSRVHS
jgi:para-nitrobenzyl esterase